MKHYSILIFSVLALLIISNITFGDYGLKNISLPHSYEGWVSLKVTGTHHYSIPEKENSETWYHCKEIITQNGKVNALLMGNYLIYMPAIDKPWVTGTVNYNRHCYRDGKQLSADTAPSQNITSQNSRNVIGLYINYTKKTYTLSLGLSAEGESTQFHSVSAKIESQTKKRFELEKVELTLPLPQDLNVLKGSQIISSLVATPNPLHKVLTNEKIIEISWEFIASSERIDLTKEILDQMDQNNSCFGTTLTEKDIGA